MVGIIGRLFKMSGGKLDRKGVAPGRSVIVTGEGFEGETVTTEIFQSSGIIGVPGDGTHGVWVPIGGSDRYGVVVAMHNYKINVSLNKGDVAIYSTKADGSGPEAVLILRSDGNIELNGVGRTLVTHAELQTALTALCATLTAHVHPTVGAPSPGLASLTCNIASAEATKLKTGI